ncbi:MAG TPA: PadR family transcriptional regulator [Acidimicrobiales bacterium]|nr:PadR family transcriptional regulator [Acidimicrobiales bacterium]
MADRSPALTTTSYALLGLLALRPWTTYELTKQVQRSLGWFWPRTERKLYDEPKKLVAAGLASAIEQRTGKRPRTVYAITAAGRRAMRAWLDEPPAPPVLEMESMVKVFFADSGTIDQLRATLDEVRTSAEQRLEQLERMIDEDEQPGYEFAGRLPINALGLRFHVDHERHLVEWATWAQEQVSAWRSPVDAAGWDWRAALRP